MNRDEMNIAAGKADAFYQNAGAVSIGADSMPELSEDFLLEYKKLMTTDLPNLWDRIEKALPEKVSASKDAPVDRGAENITKGGAAVSVSAISGMHSAESAAAGSETLRAASGNQAENVPDGLPGGTSVQKEGVSDQVVSFADSREALQEKKKRRKLPGYAYGVIVAACICGLVAIPAMLLHNSGKSDTNHSMKADVASEASGGSDTFGASDSADWDSGSAESAANCLDSVIQSYDREVGMQSNEADDSYDYADEACSEEASEADYSNADGIAASESEQGVNPLFADDGLTAPAAADSPGKHQEEVGTQSGGVNDANSETADDVVLFDQALASYGIGGICIQKLEERGDEAVYLVELPEDTVLTVDDGGKVTLAAKVRIVVLSGSRLQYDDGSFSRRCDLEEGARYSMNLYPVCDTDAVNGVEREAFYLVD